MTFSSFDYALPGIVLPTLMFFGLLVSAFCVSRYFGRRKYSIGVAVSPFFIVAFLSILGIATFSQAFYYPLSALLQPNAVQFVTVGRIDAIEPAPHPPRYYNPINRSIASPQFLTIDNEQYYLPYCELEVGQTIELLWVTDAHVAYSYSIVSDCLDDKSYTYPVYPTELKHQESTYDDIGQTIASICSGMFLFFVLIQYPLGQKLSVYFTKRDREIVNRMIPNRFGLLYIFCLFCPLAGIAIGLSMRGFTGALFILVMVSFVIIRLAIKKQTTTVTIDNNSLIIKTIGSLRRIEKGDIVAVDYGKSHMPYNRCLIITLRNGLSLQYEQEHFLGLESMYKVIKLLIR